MGRGLATSQTERAYVQAAHHDEQRQQRHCPPFKTPPRMRISTSTRTIFLLTCVSRGSVFERSARNPKCTKVSIAQTSSIASLPHSDGRLALLFPHHQLTCEPSQLPDAACAASSQSDAGSAPSPA